MFCISKEDLISGNSPLPPWQKKRVCVFPLLLCGGCVCGILGVSSDWNFPCTRGQSPEHVTRSEAGIYGKF